MHSAVNNVAEIVGTIKPDDKSFSPRRTCSYIYYRLASVGDALILSFGESWAVYLDRAWYYLEWA